MPRLRPTSEKNGFSIHRIEREKETAEREREREREQRERKRERKRERAEREIDQLELNECAIE